MGKTLWSSPVAPTALTNVRFSELLKRTCALSCEYESDIGAIVSITFTFAEVQAVKITYGYACTAEMVELAYGELVDVGTSKWLSSIQKQLESYNETLLDSRAQHSNNVQENLERYLLDTVTLKHLMI